MSDNGPEQIVELSAGKFKVMGKGKKPFMFSGAGLLGMMVCTLDGTKVLCHNCGRTFSFLHGKHLWHVHGLTARTYKEAHSLFYNQSLASPQITTIRRQVALDMKKRGILAPSGLTAEQRTMAHVSAQKSNRMRPPKRTMASRNSFATCPEQMVARLYIIADEWEVKPEEVIATMDPLLTRSVECFYGSWNEGKIKLLQVEKNQVNRQSAHAKGSMKWRRKLSAASAASS